MSKEEGRMGYEKRGVTDLKQLEELDVDVGLEARMGE
jgi:hypothetical protein